MKRLEAILTALLLVAGALRVEAQLTETYSFTNLNKSVPDGNAAGLSDVKTNLSSSLANLSAVRVKLQIAGEFNGDLYGYVRHISGSTTNFCVLLNRVGRTATRPAGYDDTGLNLTFTGSPTNDIHTYRAVVTPAPGSPLTGTWQPDGRKVDPGVVLDTTPRITTLTSFNGAPGGGEWTLYLADVECGGTNMLVSWGLELTGVATPAITWPAPANIVYGTPLGAGQLNATSTVPGVFTYTPSSGTVLNAGSNQTLSVAFVPTDTNNYVSATSRVSMTVLKKALTITADSKSKLYGEALPAFTASYSGFVNGDTTNKLDAQVVLSTTATAASPAGTYPITAGGASSTNYAIGFVAGQLVINKAGTAGNVASSKNPALPGETVTFSLSVSAVAPGAGTPTGTVQFRIDGSVAGTAPLSGGTATYSNSSLSLGTHTVVAEYAGDGNFTGTTNTLSSVQLINTPPVAGPDTIERDPTNGVKVTIATLLSNDTDADGDVISFVSVSGTSAHGGTVSRQGNWIFYTPPAGFTNVDSYTYTISDGRGAPVTGAVTVNIRADNVPSPNLVITDLGDGSYLIRFDGIPGKTYRIQWTESVETPNWQTLGSRTANDVGLFEYTDRPPSGSPKRFYRSVYP